MSREAHPRLDRVDVECRLYGADVYYGFAYYCFWRTVLRVQPADWAWCAPAYFVQEGADPGCETRRSGTE